MAEVFYEVDSFKFADIVEHWSRERLVHALVIGRELAKGVINENLRFQSVNPKWVKATESLRGEPLIGYSANQGLPPIMIRSSALEHLLAVERNLIEPDLRKLLAERVTRDDFRHWLVHSGRPMPAFWYEPAQRFNHSAKSI